MKVDNDKPILETSEDLLGFNKWAKKLAQVAIKESSPTCIGIFGEWGSGKTSLMNLIKAEIDELDQDNDGKKTKKYLTVDFNSWKFESNENLLIPLLSKVAKDLEPHKLDGVNSFLDTSLRYCVGVLKNIKLSAKAKVPAFGEIGLTLNPKDVIEGYKKGDAETINKIVHKYTDEHFELFNAYNLISVLLKGSLVPDSVGVTKIFVFLDDLDRCHPDVAVSLLGRKPNLRLSY